jgi:hypothetical protein
MYRQLLSPMHHQHQVSSDSLSISLRALSVLSVCDAHDNVEPNAFTLIAHRIASLSLSSRATNKELSITLTLSHSDSARVCTQKI